MVSLRGALRSAAVGVVLAVGGSSGAAGPAAAVSGGAAEAVGAVPAVVKVDAGDRTCTGTLVDAQWVLTAASCMVPDPAQFGQLAAGAPSAPVKVLFGAEAFDRSRPGVAVVHSEPAGGGRDLVLLKLGRPVAGIAPVPVAGAGPAVGEQLSFTGYGRTGSAWLAPAAHTAGFTVGAVDADTVSVSASSAVLCAGDAGAPGFRPAAGGGVELAGVVSRGDPAGCLYEQGTSAGAVAVRADTVAGWIHTVTAFGIAEGSAVAIRAGASSGSCLVAGSGRADTAPCAADPRAWKAEAAGPDTFRFRHVASGSCLAVPADPAADGRVLLEGCDVTGDRGLWRAAAVTGGVSLKNPASGRYLAFTASGGSAAASHTAQPGTGTVWRPGSGDASVLAASDVIAVSGTALYRYRATEGPGLYGAGEQLGAGWQNLKKGFLADWDSDGVQDLIAQWNDGNLSVYPGWARGFRNPISLGNVWGPWTLSVGRWKATDPYPSLVGYSTDGKLYSFANTTGTGVSTTGVQVGQGWNGLGIYQIDFDGDGTTDMLAKFAGGELKLYTTDGAGNFTGEAAQVGNGWDVIDDMTPVQGFAGAGTLGVAARTTGGDLRYYPIYPDPVHPERSWGAPVTIGWGWHGLKIFTAGA